MYIHICNSLSLYVCMYVCMYVYIYIYIYKHPVLAQRTLRVPKSSSTRRQLQIGYRISIVSCRLLYVSTYAPQMHRWLVKP